MFAVIPRDQSCVPRGILAHARWPPESAGSLPHATVLFASSPPSPRTRSGPRVLKPRTNMAHAPSSPRAAPTWRLGSAVPETHTPHGPAKHTLNRPDHTPQHTALPKHTAHQHRTHSNSPRRLKSSRAASCGAREAARVCVSISTGRVPAPLEFHLNYSLGSAGAAAVLKVELTC